MVSYDFRNHIIRSQQSQDPISEEDDILIRENVGDYVIAVENDETSNIIFKQGMIYNNTKLLDKNREGNTVNIGDIIYDGAFAYIINTTTNNSISVNA